MWWELSKYDTETWVSKCCWKKSGAERLAPGRVFHTPSICETQHLRSAVKQSIRRWGVQIAAGNRDSREIQSWTYVLVSCYSSSDHSRHENKLRSVKKFSQEQNRGLAQESMCTRGKETQRMSSPGGRRRPARGWTVEFSFEAKSPFLVPVFFKLQVVTPRWIVRSVL